MKIYKIADTDASTLIGMNGGQIESPNGERIVYARKKDITVGEGMELWVCNTDLTGHRKLMTFDCFNHNGPSASFIDNSTVVFRDMSNNTSRIVIMDVDTGEIKYSIYGKEGHRAEGGIYPFSISEEYLGKNPDYPMLDKTGIYTLNVASGEIKHVLSGEGIVDLVRSNGLTPTSSTISVSHVQLNPSATAVMMRIGVEECKVFGALGCYDIDTGKTHMIPDKPVHQLWFDDETYMATRQFAKGRHIEMETSYIARFSKDGEELEVLGGISNHMDGSPDRRLFAGDRCYPGYATHVYVYERGNKTPLYTVEMEHLEEMVWKHNIHPNPSFSVNGKRLYFNMPVRDGKTEASFIEL